MRTRNLAAPLPDSRAESSEEISFPGVVSLDPWNMEVFYLKSKTIKTTSPALLALKRGFGGQLTRSRNGPFYGKQRNNANSHLAEKIRYFLQMIPQQVNNFLIQNPK